MTLKELLKKQGLTQEELANNLRISQPAVSSWVNGVAMPKTKDLLQIADVLGVSVEQLLNCFEK